MLVYSECVCLCSVFMGSCLSEWRWYKLFSLFTANNGFGLGKYCTLVQESWMSFPLRPQTLKKRHKAGNFALKGVARNIAKMTTAAELTCLKSFQTAAGKTYVTQSTSGGTLVHRCLIPATSVDVFHSNSTWQKAKTPTQNILARWILTVVSCRYHQRCDVRVLHHRQKNQCTNVDSVCAEPHGR